MTTTNKTAHTPTPWTTGKGTVTIRANTDGDKAFIATTRTHGGYHQRDDDTCAANAAHIVRCVNAHDALVAALRFVETDVFSSAVSRAKAIIALRDAGVTDESEVAK